MSTPLRTPGSARTRALGFTHDSDSDDDFSPGASSAARLASVRFGYPSAGVSSASRIRSRELAAARNFREASREKATLKQHCDELEEKVKALEQSLSETVAVTKAQKELELEKETKVESPSDAERALATERDAALAAAEKRAAAADAELASLRAELALATENHEWLRRALEARTAANATAETERQALSARVVELERILDESEAHLSALQVEREAHKMKYKRRAAAATAQRLAAEATAAMLKGEIARMRAQMETSHASPKSETAVLADATNRAVAGLSEPSAFPRVAGGAENSAPSETASPSCAKDDSAMGCVGPAEDGSESVSKPARKRDVALSSPAAAMEFERAPGPKRFFKAAGLAGLAARTSSALRPQSARTKGIFFLTDVSPRDSVAGSARLFVRVASALMRDAEDARRGVRVTPRTASVNLFLACLVTACVFLAMRLSSATAFEPLGLKIVYGVRMGGVPPQKTFGAEGAFGFFSFLNHLRNGLARLGVVMAA